MNTSLFKAGVAILALFVIRSYYDEYNKNEDILNNDRNNAIIHDYLLKDIPEDKLKKPILWIHIPYTKNSRFWDNFYSRNNEELNQPYMYLCIKSIIDKCGDSFHICIIDDNSFEKLLPNWNIDMTKFDEPIKGYIRNLGFLKLIYQYGGLFVPPSFVCYKNLIQLYNNNNSPFFGELKNNSHISNISETFPSYKFMGSLKENNTIYDLIKMCEITIHNNTTDEINFDGTLNKLIYEKINTNRAFLIDGKLIGSKNSNNDTIYIENLFSEEVLTFHKDIVGVYLPSDELLIRNKFNWFTRLHVDDCIIGDLNISLIIKKSLKQYL